MEEKIYIINLFDCYMQLLTEKQKNYFKEYYFNDFSLTEISENQKVSRNAVYKQVKETTFKLKEYEKKLGLFSKKQKLYDIIKKIEDKQIKEELEKLL